MTSRIVHFIILVSAFFILLSGCKKVGPVLLTTRVEIVFSPQGTGDQGYNDKILYGIQKASEKYGFTLAIHIPKDANKGKKIYEDWLKHGLDKDCSRTLFIFSGEEYLPIAEKISLPDDPRMDVMMFETKKPIDRVYTFRISSYAAAYLAGATSVLDYGDMEQHACIIAANPHDINVKTAVDGYKDGFMAAGGNGYDIYYLSENSYEGYNMQDKAYQLCNKNYGNYTFYFSAAGASNKGVYRYSREMVDFAVGMDDYMSLFSSFIPLSVVKHIDKAIIDILGDLLAGKDIPYHQEFTYESGYEEMVFAPIHTADNFLDITHISNRIIDIEKEYEESNI